MGETNIGKLLRALEQVPLDDVARLDIQSELKALHAAANQGGLHDYRRAEGPGAELQAAWRRIENIARSYGLDPEAIYRGGDDEMGMCRECAAIWATRKAAQALAEAVELTDGLHTEAQADGKGLCHLGWLLAGLREAQAVVSGYANNSASGHQMETNGKHRP